MKINDFIEEFKNATDKDECIKKHIKITYVPYERKIALCKNIANSVTHVNNKFIVNSPMKYVFLSLTLFSTYTDIETETGKNVMGSFNILNEQRATQALVNNLNKDEYFEFNQVLQMTLDDIYYNERDLTNYISDKIEALQVMLDSLNDVVSNSDFNTEDGNNEDKTIRRTSEKSKKNTKTNG